MGGQTSPLASSLLVKCQMVNTGSTTSDQRIGTGCFSKCETILPSYSSKFRVVLKRKMIQMIDIAPVHDHLIAMSASFHSTKWGINHIQYPLRLKTKSNVLVRAKSSTFSIKIILLRALQKRIRATRTEPPILNTPPLPRLIFKTISSKTKTAIHC